MVQLVQPGGSPGGFLYGGDGVLLVVVLVTLLKVAVAADQVGMVAVVLVTMNVVFMNQVAAVAVLVMDAHLTQAIESPITFTSSAGSPLLVETHLQVENLIPNGIRRQNMVGGKGDNSASPGYEGRIIINYGPPSNVTENTISYGYSGGDHQLTLP